MAVAFVNTGTNTVTAGASFNTSFTVSATGPNHIAIVPVVWDNITGLSVSSITLGGVAMTACGAAVQANSGSDWFAYVRPYYLLNPPSGSQALVISVPSANEIYANVTVFSGVDAVTPIVNYTTSSTGILSLTGAVTVPSSANQITVSAATAGGGVVITGTNQTSDGINVGGGHTAGSDHCTTPGSSITHTWTADNQSFWAVAGFSLSEIVTLPQVISNLKTMGQGRPPRAFRPGIAR